MPAIVARRMAHLEIGLRPPLRAGDPQSPTSEVRARVAVRDEIKQPAGLVHGGVFASIAETIASLGTWRASRRRLTAQGHSNQTSFLRPIVEGTIHAIARRRHRGRTTWVWEVDITDDQGRLCALVRMTDRRARNLPSSPAGGCTLDGERGCVNSPAAYGPLDPCHSARTR